MADQFVSLHNHSSAGSMLDALHSSKQLIDRAKALGQTSVALTDHGAVNEIFHAYRYAKTQGIKLIPGCEFYWRHDVDDPGERGSKHIVLLAMNKIGWSNILKLNFAGWKNQKTVYMKQYPIIEWRTLAEYSTEGIIALTACSSGILSRHIMNNDEEKAHCDVNRLYQIFGDNLFLEIQPHTLKTENGKVDQVKVNNEIVKLSKQYNIRLIGTCDAHYNSKEDAVYHDMLLAIKDKKPLSDPFRHKYSVQEFYPKPGAALVDFFGASLGIELIKNSKMIADRCEEPVYLDPPKTPILPEFSVSDTDDYLEFKIWKETNNKKELPDDVLYLRYKTASSFQKKFSHLEPEELDEYWKRLKQEVSVIEERGFSSYMLIVADYVNWAKKNDVVVGSGRGSGCGSLLGHLFGITTPDPIKHKLLFERFINKYKKALPDYDIDFSVPEKVKDYMRSKYGDKRIAQVSNIMRMKPKVVVKDVARSLELGKLDDDTEEEAKSKSFKLANEITKTMNDDAKTIEEAMVMSKDLATFMYEYPKLLENCKRLQNIERQSGVHAAAIVVSNEDLDAIAPLRCDKEGNLVLAYDKEIAEEVGFVKFDFLGLTTLQIMDETVKNIEKRTGKKIVIDDIQDGDVDVYNMIGRGETKCVFQLEASLTPLCKAVKPKNIDDLAIITTIGRPGVPAEDRKEYIERRFRRSAVELLHPKMAASTADTFGLLVFEEQLMFLAKDIAGWDFYKSDALRKITKLKDKGIELQIKTGKEFIDDAIKNGIDKESANAIWDRVVIFGKYSFNCSHAVAYSYISYQTAWLKYHYPVEFMCAVLNAEDPNSDKLLEYKQVAKEMGITITVPDVKNSSLQYLVVDDKTIATGLTAIKGIGDAAIEHIIKNRPYESFPMFILKSIGTKGNRSPITKTVIESLAKSGCFDILGITRKNALEHWEGIKTKVSAAMKKAAKNDAEIDISNVMNDIDPLNEYSKKEILQNEMEAIGQYLSGTHNDIFGGFFKGGPEITNFENINIITNGKKIKIEAIVKLKVKELKIKKKGRNFGKMFAKYLLEDINGKTTEITLWPDHYEKYKSILLDGTPIKAICEINEYLDTHSLVLNHIEYVPDAIINGKIIK